jgi:hypothetical protein
MKKFLLPIIVSLLAVVGLTGAGVATSTSHSVPAKVLSATASQQSAGIKTLQAKLRQFHGRKLTAKDLRALGLRPASKSLAGHRLRPNGARIADVGCTYWYTYQYAGFVWVNRWYCGPYYSYPWYPYYYLYDNFYLCNYANSGCVNTHVWYWQYYLYY